MRNITFQFFPSCIGEKYAILNALTERYLSILSQLHLFFTPPYDNVISFLSILSQLHRRFCRSGFPSYWNGFSGFQFFPSCCLFASTRAFAYIALQQLGKN
ncbi:MAG: hypothetical protein N3E41_08780 [Thermofilaceae archaeon]|nr:hypothetical protein [Thermofilaceae archaeon]